MTDCCSKMLLLLGLLSFLWTQPVQCLQEDGAFTFGGEIRHFSVASDMVYIATEENLYQLSHDLRLVRSLTQRGILDDQDRFQRVSGREGGNVTFSVNLLLPFVKNHALFTCGVSNNCGYCEVVDLKNVSNLVYREPIQVGPLRSSSASVSFLVDVKKDSGLETYILTAIEKQQGESEDSSCRSTTKTINLQNSDHSQEGGMFSFTDNSETPVISSRGPVEFVDGFQINSTVFLLSNVRSGDKSNKKVRVSWLEAEGNKVQTLKSLRSADVSVSDGGEGSRLLASSVIPGGQSVLWSGVFSVDGGQTNTQLVLFDISPDPGLVRSPPKVPDFYDRDTETQTRKPKAVLLRRNHMTSVLAVRRKTWMLFFIGTQDGRLIKLVVDRNYHPACPKVIYRANDDHRVFPRLHLDPVDHKHVYVPFRKQMKRVPVSKCSTYTTLQDCWSAQDPDCVWCRSKQSCIFEDECTDSDWLSIPDQSQQKIVSHKVAKDPSGKIKLVIQTHLSVGKTGPSNFTCQFSAASEELCSQNTKAQAHFPQCTCVLTKDSLPADGLNVRVKILLGMMQLSEEFKLFNCSDITVSPSSALCQRCISHGCGWSKNSCSWATQGVQNDRVCSNTESVMNVSKPEISSITPSVVTSHGRNHALLLGRDLQDVTRVRVQGGTDCTPKESPVWNNTGVNLTFHIPSTDSEGVVKVCLLLPDGSCHGNSEITYWPSPFCTSIVPRRTWISGKRRLTLVGAHLEFVEGVMHSHVPQQVSLPMDSSSQTLTYETPAAEPWISSSSVLLKVANQTLSCSTKLTYDPDPEFTGFISKREGHVVRVVIQKKADELGMTAAELSVWGVQDGKQYPCVFENKDSRNTTVLFICEILNSPVDEFQHLLIKYGGGTVMLGPPSVLHQVLLMLRLLLVPCIIAALLFICCWKRRRDREMKL